VVTTPSLGPYDIVVSCVAVCLATPSAGGEGVVSMQGGPLSSKVCKASEDENGLIPRVEDATKIWPALRAVELGASGP